MGRGGAVLAALALAAGFLVATPSAVSACISEHPTFVEAVRGARAIARVKIVEVGDTSTSDPITSETYRVEQVLKGTLPRVVTLDPAWTSLCHDTVAFYAEGSDGNTLIIAFDVPYYDQTIHPMWTTYDAQVVVGSAGVPPGIATLARLEAAILAELAMPDTSTAEPQRGDAWPFAFILAAAIVASAASVRRSGEPSAGATKDA